MLENGFLLGVGFLLSKIIFIVFILFIFISIYFLINMYIKRKIKVCEKCNSKNVILKTHHYNDLLGKLQKGTLVICKDCSHENLMKDGGL